MIAIGRAAFGVHLPDHVLPLVVSLVIGTASFTAMSGLAKVATWLPFWPFIQALFKPFDIQRGSRRGLGTTCW